MYKDKIFLVTGGTGSFGHTVVSYLLEQESKEVRVLSRDEAKQDLMRTTFDYHPRLKFYIGDVRERDSVDHAMRGVNNVFHAAALKQVPSCDFFPIQAVWTNIVGSHNVIESAIMHEAERVVCLSTDKAVYPINAMGMTKAIMEKVAQAATRHIQNGETLISCVRYGNVMYSRGSVIPRFVQQIKEETALTITDPAMTRFLLPLRDAVALVDYAFLHARQGDIFIRKAPACTIEILALALLNIFNADIPIKIIGTRHGEKLFETLASKEELKRGEDLGDYFRISMDERNLNYESYFTHGTVDAFELSDYHSHNTDQLSIEETEKILLTLPEIQRELAAIEMKA